MEPNPEHQVNDVEVLKKMEDEHLRLQRQVRMIQTDRLHRTVGVHPQFRRQDNLMRVLKSEYNSLRKDLKIARSGAHKKKDKKMKKDLKIALLFRESAKQDVIGGENVMGEIDDLIQRNEKIAYRWRKLVKTNTGQLEERRVQAERRLVSTENKLETAQLRFNAVKCENNQIREEIEHMLKDRALFNQAWNKMLSVLGKGKKFLTDLFESSTLAYDQRDEWVAKLRSVQEKGKMDQLQQIQEMQELVKAFNHEMKLYHFLAAKGVTRVNKKEEMREEEEKRKEEEEIAKQYEYYCGIIQDVYAYANKEFEPKDPLSETVKQFRRKEQENDSIYRLLVDRCAENDVLRRNVSRIRQEAYDRKDWNDSSEERRQKKLSRMQKELDEQTAKTEALRSNCQKQQQLLQDTMDKVNDIFNMLDCSLEPYQNLLGDKLPTLYTFHLTMLLITEKVKGLKETAYYYERMMKKKGDPKSTLSRLKTYTVHAETPVCLEPLPINVMVPADPCPVCIETRWLSRISDRMETPLGPKEVLKALEELSSDPAYLKSDRIHTLTECRVPRSRAILAKRYMAY